MSDIVRYSSLSMGVIAFVNIIMNMFQILPEPKSNRFAGLMCYSVFIYSYLYSANNKATQNTIEQSTRLCCENISNLTYYENNGCVYLTNKYLCEVNYVSGINIQPSFSFIMIYGAIVITYMIAHVVELLDVDFKMIINQKIKRVSLYFVYYMIYSIFFII